MSAATLAGVVLGLDEATYHAHPALSSTGVRALLDSPARFDYDRTHRRESRTFDLGRAVHARVLGAGMGVVAYPDEHLTPSGNVSTKAATTAWAQEQREAGLTPVSAADLTEVEAMAEAVLAHPAARQAFELATDREVSVFATDPDTGVECRARYDALDLDTGIGVDLKTTSGSASAGGFGRESARFGYPIQEAHYAACLRWATGQDVPAMRFVVVEKRRPYLVAVHTFTDAVRIAADAVAADARATYAECLAADQWPGYGTDITPVDLPAWWWARVEGDTDDMEVL